MSFQPRVLVTGGGLGIGCSTVHFLLEKYNARIVAFTLEHGPEFDNLLTTFGGDVKRLILVQGDVTNEADTERAVQMAVVTFGGLDALVISAAIEPTPMRIIDMSYATYCRTMMINVCGPFLTIQRCLPHLRSSTTRPTSLRARILVLSSTADKGIYAGRSAYNTSKAALSLLVENLVNEERESGVEVLGIYPGFTQTGLAKGLIDRRFDAVLWPEEAEKYKRWIDGGKVEGPEWCGEACARLAVGASEGLVGKLARYNDHVPELKHGWWLSENQ